jgi:hypothetical protein
MLFEGSMDHARKRRRLADGGNVFIPVWRMRQIRWEESVARARARRRREKAEIIHLTCHCGFIGCIAVPVDMVEVRRFNSQGGSS